LPLLKFQPSYIDKTKRPVLTITTKSSYLPSTPGLAVYWLFNDAVAISDSPNKNSNTTSEQCIGKHTELIVS